ncbi:MAG: right-handed parallel beta-helix repeat-containing protein, partial [Porticoccaceae bacterium]|nr:right-handed parallel beta-helix repeat-containing protein [Porticoccaceae bacterium]
MKQLLLLLSFCSCTTALCESYYLNALQGNDANAGTSIHSPWRTLERANRAPLVAGDQLLLAAGQTFSGCLILVDRKGTADKPIQVSSYPLQGSLDSRARIDARGHTQGVLIKNSSHVVVSNLDISASAGGLQGSQQGLESLEGLANMRVGALVLTTRRGDYRNITLCDLYIHDVFMEEPGFQRGSDEVNTANGTQRYGWGIRVINRHKKARISGIKLLANRIHNVAHTGIKFTGGAGGIHDILVADNRVTETGGPGIQGSLIEDAVFRGNRVNRSGSADDSRKWGRGSG